jgi:anaerobic selenocysteine-containing dehydrogenase
MTKSTKTLCPYCGVGCGLEVLPPAQPGKPVSRDSQGNPIWQVRGDRTHPSSQVDILPPSSYAVTGDRVGEWLFFEQKLLIC